MQKSNELRSNIYGSVHGTVEKKTTSYYGISCDQLELAQYFMFEHFGMNSMDSNKNSSAFDVNRRLIKIFLYGKIIKWKSSFGIFGVWYDLVSLTYLSRESSIIGLKLNRLHANLSGGFFCLIIFLFFGFCIFFPRFVLDFFDFHFPKESRIE